PRARRLPRPRSGRCALEHLCRTRGDSILPAARRQAAEQFLLSGRRRGQDVAARDRLPAKLEKMMSEQMPSVVGRVFPLELGPPVGWPVQYRVSGPDPSEVRSIALRLAEILGSDRHIAEVSFDWMEPARQARVTIDQDKARLLGLSSRAIAEVMNT